jgi:hypothetical protein
VLEPSGVGEPLQGGLLAQASLADAPIAASPERLAELDRKRGGRAFGGAAEPSGTSELAPEPAAEPAAAPVPAPVPELAEAPAPPAPMELPSGDFAVDGAAPAASAAAADGVPGWPSSEPPLPGIAALQAPLASIPPAAPVTPRTALPPAPESDRGALLALDAGLRAAAPPAPAPSFDDGTVRAGVSLAPCAPPEPGLLTVPVSQLVMLRSWVEGSELRAELRAPGGELATVVRGDRVGPEGGRVVMVGRDSVLVGEIGFDLSGNPIIVQRTVRLGR